MPSSEEIQRLRSTASDDAIFNHFYSQDPSFKTAVDKVKSANPTMGVLEEANFPKAMLNIYYKVPHPSQASPLTTQMSESLGESSKDAGMLTPNPVEEASLEGFAGNVLKSGGRMARDIGSAVYNWDQTAKGLGKAVLGGAINAAETVTGNEDLFNNPLGSEDVASAIGKFYVDRYGGLENLKKTAYEDPIGLLSDVASVITAGGAVIKGGANLGMAATRAATSGASAVPLASRAAQIGRAASTAAKIGEGTARFGLNLEPTVMAGKAAIAGARGVGKVGKFGVSQVTGFAPETIDTIAKNPAFSQAQAGKISRTTLGEKVKGAITKLQDEVADTGSEYKVIREANSVTQLPPDTFRSVLKAEGLQFDEAGKVMSSINGPDLSASEIAEINKFLGQVDDLGGSVTSNQFLRIRERLTNMSNFERTTRASNTLENLAKGMRKALNEKARKSIPGLEELDAKFGPMREQLSLFEREFIDPVTGDLKPAAYGKLANLTGKGKEVALERVKQIVPNIEQDINALRAMEDVQLAGSQKVGSYMKGAIGGYALTGGNALGGIAGLIFATPSISTKIIKAYGKVSGINATIIQSIANRLGVGKKLTAEQAAIMSAALQWAESNFTDTPEE